MNLSIILAPVDQYLCLNSWTMRSYVYFIHAMLVKSGFKVSLRDFLDRQQEFNSFFKAINEDTIGCYCIVIFTNNRIGSLKLAKKIKAIKKSNKIIFTGPFLSIFYKQILTQFPEDLAVLRDAEFTLPKLLSYPLERKYFHRVGNIAYMDRNVIRLTSIKLEDNLDKLPFVSSYFIKNKHSPIPIAMSRGCPFRCTFCDRKNLWGNKIRFRSVKNTIEEIEFLVKSFDTKRIIFDDSNFIIDRKRVYSLCKELIKKKLKISWKCSTRVDAIDMELLKLMKFAGCQTIYYGVESGSEIILRNIGKNYSKEQIVKAVKLTKEMGIKVGLFIMIGGPGETRGTLRETKKLLLKLYPFDELNINPFVVLPGTKLYSNLLSERKIEEKQFINNGSALFYDVNWKEYEDEIKSMYNFFEVCPSNTISIS